MEYREDQWQAKGKKLTIQKRWVSLPKISPYLVKAIIIAEDDKFWSHHGFDVDAIQNALEKNIEKGKFKFGGSTISQQLVKNLYLTPAKNPVRKLKEAIITWRVEQTISKRRILELYLECCRMGQWNIRRGNGFPTIFREARGPAHCRRGGKTCGYTAQSDPVQSRWDIKIH